MGRSPALNLRLLLLDHGFLSAFAYHIARENSKVWTSIVLRYDFGHQVSGGTVSMRRSASIWSIGSLILLAITAATAQHTPGAKFDLTKPRTLKGTVTQIDWANPTVHILMKVPTNTRPDLWAVELDSAILLARNGWTAAALPLGETITVQGFSARDGSKQLSGNSVVMANGKSVFSGTNGPTPPRAAASGPAPRWPNGKPRLGPSPGQTGYWGNPSGTALIQTGANVQTDAYGLLKNIADLDKVAPMQKWARDLYEYRQRNFLKDDPMYLACKPPGGPRQFEQIYGFQFVENPDFDRIFVLLGGGNRNRRVIYTDGRQQVGQVNGDADNPLYYGRAVAHWEGDALVVDVKGFNEKFWFDNGGLPHTEQLHLIEKFTRVDMKTMKYEVTIDDPGAYTKSWTSSWTLEWIPGEELPYFLCQDNRP